MHPFRIGPTKNFNKRRIPLGATSSFPWSCKKKLEFIHKALTKSPDVDVQFQVKNVSKGSSAVTGLSDNLTLLSTILLTGFGGIKKTQVALEYAYRVCNERIILY